MANRAVKRAALKAQDIDTIRRVVQKQNPSIVGLVDRLGKIPVTGDEIEELRHAIADELLAIGFPDDPTVHDQAMILEELIDKVGHANDALKW